MLDVSYNWIYKIPCIGSVIANLFFLVAIVIILVSKLHTDVSERAAMIKTAKAIGETERQFRAFRRRFEVGCTLGLCQFLKIMINYSWFLLP